MTHIVHVALELLDQLFGRWVRLQIVVRDAFIAFRVGRKTRVMPIDGKGHRSGKFFPRPGRAKDGVLGLIPPFSSTEQVVLELVPIFSEVMKPSRPFGKSREV